MQFIGLSLENLKHFHDHGSLFGIFIHQTVSIKFFIIKNSDF